MYKLTLITIADGKNIEATKKSVVDFMKYNGPVIVVNNQHSDEVNRIGSETGATVYTPLKKYDYPSYSADQIDGLIDFTYNSVFKPAMMIDTEYFMIGEPDCIYLNKINYDIFLKNTDIIVPSDQTPTKLSWVFSPFYSCFGANNEERDFRINGFIVDLWKYCHTLGIDFDAASKNDMRFVFMANSIIKTDKIRELYFKEKSRITLLVHKIVELVDKYKPDDAIISSDVSHLVKYFGPDQIFSIIFGLYIFKWRVNDNGLNCLQSNFVDVESLHNYVDQNPNIEYIHSCKIYYNK